MTIDYPKPPTFNMDDWLTTGQAAKLVGYSRIGIQTAIRRGLIPSVMYSGRRYLYRTHVLLYAQHMKDLGPSKHDPWRTQSRVRKAE